MPSKVRPEVEIQLDKKRHLLVDLNAMVAFEETTGKSLMQGMDLESMTAKDFRVLLWACLLHEDDSLTLEEVGRMIHAGNMGKLAGKMIQAWDVAIPEQKDDGLPLTKSPSNG
jgi:hypothetical protein